MQEAFLHYIWQYQYFNKEGLRTVDDENVDVMVPGFLNRDAGPDFKDSKLKIGDIEWRGSIEIHVKSSEWNLHNHGTDRAYDNVVLHVVWQNKQPAYRSDGTLIPTLELKNRVDLDLIERYQKLVDQESKLLPCGNSFAEVPAITKVEMLDRVAMERLEGKAKNIDNLLKKVNGDWVETTYQLLMKSFGLKVNAEVFERLSTLLPFKIIKKHSSSLTEIEALLFGVAGFLIDTSKDDYHKNLKAQFDFLKHKYSLDLQLNKWDWKFLRLRPANFPTVRLSQLAAVLSNTDSLFDQLINIQDDKELKNWLRSKPSFYWQKHYDFGKESSSKLGALGKDTLDLIIINVVVPLLVTYGKQQSEQEYIDRAIQWLECIRPEQNRVTRIFQSLELQAKSALDSQAILQLYSAYCTQKKCLRCSIGNFIVKPR